MSHLSAVLVSSEPVWVLGERADDGARLLLPHPARLE